MHSIKKISRLYVIVIFAFGCNINSPEGTGKFLLMESNVPIKKGDIDINVSKNKNIIRYVRTYKSKERRFLFRKEKGSYYEQKIVADFDGHVLDTLDLLSFSMKDTLYTYKPDIEKYPPTSPLGSEDFICKIYKISPDYYLTEKTAISSLLDKEVYVYNNKYEILMIILFRNKDYYSFINPLQKNHFELLMKNSYIKNIFKSYRQQLL